MDEETMSYLIEEIVSKIALNNPLHGKKLFKNLKKCDSLYFDRSEEFLLKYQRMLISKSKSLDFAIDCYLQMIADITSETIKFQESFKYSSSTFAEVNQRVYANPQVMEYYIHGILMSQFLWQHHYRIYDYFIGNLQKFSFLTFRYLEIGAGHGLYLSQACSKFDKVSQFEVVDISSTSIELAKSLFSDPRVTFVNSDILQYSNSELYNFITVGEVIEHLEKPLELLQKICSLLSPDGTVFITAPTNGPTIDHIYLFHNVDEIRTLLRQGGFDIIEENCFCAEDIPIEMADELKVTVMYAAYLKKHNN
jgi:2-polyprenyl-3-methyl-5-hydroxy-6-metoxy-1,4-benzoquinol methylase